MGVTCFVAMPDDTLCWLRRLVVKKEYRFKGELRTKLLLKDKKDPVSVTVLFLMVGTAQAGGN